MNKEIFSVYTAAAGKFCVESDKKPAKKGFSSVYLTDGGEAVLFWELYPEKGGGALCVLAERPFGMLAKYLYSPTWKESEQLFDELRDFFTAPVWFALLDNMEVEKQ